MKKAQAVLPKDVADTDQPANRLAAIRKARGVTQIDLSARLGITQSMLSKYEQGDLRLHGDMLARLAEILSVSTDDLLGVHVTPMATPPALKDKRLRHRIHQIDRLSKRDRQALIRTIDAFIGRAEIANSDLRTRSKISVRIWTADPSRLASLLVVAIRRVFLLLAPRQPGASTAPIHTSIFSRGLNATRKAG